MCPTRVPLEKRRPGDVVRITLQRLARSGASGPYQQDGQEAAGNNVECQAKARPPMRYARVWEEAVMDQIKNSVHKASNCEPKTDFEGEQCHQQTPGDQGLDNHHV